MSSRTTINARPMITCGFRRKYAPIACTAVRSRDSVRSAMPLPGVTVISIGISAISCPPIGEPRIEERIEQINQQGRHADDEDRDIDDAVDEEVIRSGD